MRYDVFVCDICYSEHPKERAAESILLNRYTSKELSKDICKKCSTAIHSLIDKMAPKKEVSK